MKITLHHHDWADALSDIVAESRSRLSITGLSYLFPNRAALGPWRQLHSNIALAPVRGISVRVMLPAPSSAHPATAQNERTAKQFEQYGVRVQLIAPTKLLHAKTVLVDDKLACVGSGNWTQAATCHNHEVWTVTDDATVVAQLRQIHDVIARQSVAENGVLK